MRVFDLDRDRVIAADEIMAAAQSLEKLDVDKDGRLTARELMAAMGGFAPENRGDSGRAPSAETFKRLDANRDGKLGKDELPPQMQARWDRMDRNGDGFVDEEEQAAILQRVRQGRGGRPPGRP